MSRVLVDVQLAALECCIPQASPPVRTPPAAAAAAAVSLAVTIIVTVLHARPLLVMLPVCAVPLPQLVDMRAKFDVEVSKC